MPNNEKLNEFCAEMAAVNVETVWFEYDGEGDSANYYMARCVRRRTATEIAEQECLRRDRIAKTAGWERPVQPVEQIYLDSNSGIDKLTKLNPKITAKLLEEIWEIIFESLPGSWEVDSGSFGEVTVDVAARTANVTHNERVTDVHTHEFPL